MKIFDISEIDSNFKGDAIVFENMKTYNALQQPFVITGVTFDGEKFVRMPEEVAAQVNTGVLGLYADTSGGRIRFRTNSSKITLTVILPRLSKMQHMPQTGSSCLDLYSDDKYIGPFRCNYKLRDDGSNLYEGSATINLYNDDMKDITMNFPLYNRVSAVYISLNEDSKLEAPNPEKYEIPIVFYGSSITQGGCASHPGNAYANIISRRFNANILNLGFSGSCRGEPAMAEYLAGLEMSVFVYDYDHNAMSADYLEKTHEATFKVIRDKHPDLPVIFITAADDCYTFRAERAKRAEIIKRTYDNAVLAGDKNVYFIDGETIYADVGLDYCTVDDCHPNDLGFWCMANSIGKVIEEILNKRA